MFASWNGDWSWMWGFCWIFVMLFWALIIFGVAAMARSLFSNGTPGNRDHARPLDILKERYARSEITRDQYAQMRGDLG